jgi:flagellin
MAQTAEGALSEATDILQRMRELAVQSANETNTRSDRASLNQEFQDLNDELDRIAKTTSFNGQKILEGRLQDAQFQVGPNVGETINVNLAQSMRTEAIGGHANTELQLRSSDEVDPNMDPSQYRNYEDGDWTINGFTINNIDNYAEGNGKGSSSAYALAQAINAKSEATDVQAEATAAEKEFSGVHNANLTSGTYTLEINDEVVYQQTETGSISAEQLAEEINANLAQTGVKATFDEDGNFTLRADDGRNIEIKETIEGGQGMSYFGKELSQGDATAQQVYKGGLNLNGSRAINIESETDVDEANQQGVIIEGKEQGWSQTTDASYLQSADIRDVENSEEAIKKLDQAINDVDSFRATLGAIQNRFESTISNLRNASQNLTEARSRIMDADVAEETAKLTQNSITQKAGTSILSQANQQPQIALQLLGGG